MDDFGERLARIETKVDMLLERESRSEKRLRSVEQKQWFHTGGLATAVFLIGKLGLWPLPH